MATQSLLIGIGDLHGHTPALEGILAHLKGRYRAFDDDMVLRPGATLVFTGDYIDRGHDGRGVIDRVMRLQERNPGRVIALFGNHEMLALAARTDALEAAGAPDPQQQYRARTVHGRNGGWAFVSEHASEPAEACAFFAQSIAPQAPVGRWMRALQPYCKARIENREVLFVHGGIPAGLDNPISLEQYTRRLSKHLSQRTGHVGREKYLDHPLVGNHSVFWDRRIPSGDADPDAIARSLGVDAIVIGHTPQDRITRHGSRVFNIDVGMCPAYGENGPAAIIFTPTGIIACDLKRGDEMLEGSQEDA